VSDNKKQSKGPEKEELLEKKEKILPISTGVMKAVRG